MMYVNGQAVAPTKTSILDHNVLFKVDGADYYIASCLNGGSVSAPPNPEKSGWVFNAWKDGNDNVISFPYIPSGNIELSASFVNWQPVDWIASSNTQNQYIDTGYIPNANSKFECVFEMLSNTAQFRGIFGTYGLNTDKIFARIESSGRPYFGWGAENSYWGTSGNFKFNRKYKIEFDSTQVIITDFVTGNVETHTFTGGTINTDKHIWLFKINDLDTNCHNKIYSFKIFESGTLVKNFEPVAVDNKGAMLDTISGTVYLNDGVGDFTYGEVNN